MSEKYLHFKIKACGKEIFIPHRRSNWIYVLWKYFSNYVYLKDMYVHKLERNWNNSVRIKIDNFREDQESALTKNLK